MEWNVFEALRGTLLRGLEGLCMSRRYIFLHTTKDLRRQYSVLGIECEFLGKKQQNAGRREQLQQTDGTIRSARHSSGPDSRFFFSGGATLLPSELK